MNIFQRLFTDKKTIQKDNYSPTQITSTGIINYLMDMQTQKSNVKTSWAQLCMREMAKKVSNFETFLFQNEKQVKDHEFLRAIEKNNRYLQNWGILHQLITKSILFYGRAIIYPVNDLIGRLSNFILMPDNGVEIVQEPGGLGIAAFKVRTTTGTTLIPPNEMILITEGSISDPYKGDSLLDDVVSSIERDNLQQIFQRELYKNFGAVGTVLETDKTLNENDIKLYREVLNSYSISANSNRGAGSSLVLGDGLKIKSLSPSFKDLDFTNTRESIRDEMFAKFQLPKIAFGIYDGTYANSDTATENYIKDIIIPFSKQIENSFNNYIKNRYGEEYDLKYEYPEGISERDIQIFNTMADHPGMFTMNECRAMLNYGEMKGGDEIQKNTTGVNNGNI